MEGLELLLETLGDGRFVDAVLTDRSGDRRVRIRPVDLARGRMVQFETTVDGATTMLTDGESRNGGVTWDRDGRRIAYTSTARNGAANDLWMMDPEDPNSAELVLESPDGTTLGAVEFNVAKAGWWSNCCHCDELPVRSMELKQLVEIYIRNTITPSEHERFVVESLSQAFDATTCV